MPFSEFSLSVPAVFVGGWLAIIGDREQRTLLTLGD
jgi:hypothetical protein